MKFAADENLNNDILRALLRARSSCDVVRIQDSPMAGAADEDVLEWTAAQGRVLLTHDSRTLIGFAYERIQRGEPMPGVVVVPAELTVQQAMADLILLHDLGEESDVAGQVRYLPWR